jgi:hypothetical protein
LNSPNFLLEAFQMTFGGLDAMERKSAEPYILGAAVEYFDFLLFFFHLMQCFHLPLRHYNKQANRH